MVLTLELEPWVDEGSRGTRDTLRNATILIIVACLKVEQVLLSPAVLRKLIASFASGLFSALFRRLAGMLHAWTKGNA